MNTEVTVALLATALPLVLVTLLLGRTARRLGARLESLARPLHELRGALTALQLGLSVVDRARGLHQEPHGWIDALRLSLERATLGARDIDALRRGEPPVVDAKDQVDFRTLVLRSARSWSLLAPAFGASLEVDWRAGPVRVAGHAGRLQQALDNLIANALEHGGGRVHVEGELRGRVVRVLVSDGGRGLPRLDEALTRNEKRNASASGAGSARGHGLSIASEVIQEHEGRLGLETGRNGRGVVVELPTIDDGGAASGRVTLHESAFHAYDRASQAA